MDVCVCVRICVPLQASGQLTPVIEENTLPPPTHFYCNECEIGKFAAQGDSKCYNCTPGTYNSLNGSANCTICGYGQYQDQTGMGKCTNCTVGRYNDKLGLIASEHDALSDCSICDYGQYQSEKGQKSSPLNKLAESGNLITWS